MSIPSAVPVDVLSLTLKLKIARQPITSELHTFVFG
jgi:hypothetical protein